MLDQGKAGKGVVRIGVGLRWWIDSDRACRRWDGRAVVVDVELRTGWGYL